ncbi:hypothetical protein EVAR_31356_1 [Eumeta japonica]|uniref:Uncharacterized protein n=1 Tax=Eumeta variegata TaxID=151549 RepID=A0A4C1XD54_EUMVA|nr:hypothetical protein EVAR_31356_1 [Eumeta japonica]
MSAARATRHTPAAYGLSMGDCRFKQYNANILLGHAPAARRCATLPEEARTTVTSGWNVFEYVPPHRFIDRCQTKNLHILDLAVGKVLEGERALPAPSRQRSIDTYS